MKRNPSIIRTLVAFVLFAWLGGGACTDAEPPLERGRVLLIGIDGASMRVIEPMIEAGRLPHLAQIAERGASGKLRSIVPTLSPNIWTTVATGKLPQQHGIENWVTPGGEEGRLYASTDRKVHALWNIATEAGLTVATVNWLITYPPEPIRGVMVTDHAIRGEADNQQFIRDAFGGSAGNEPQSPRTFPVAWGKEVAMAREAQEPLTRYSDPFANATLPNAFFRDKMTEFYNEDQILTRIALRVEEEQKPEILMLLLQGIDRSSHFLWGTLEPPELYPENLRPSPQERKGGAEALRAYYQYTDALIGKLLERYGPDDLVLVVSDHGFEAGVTWKILTGVHTSEKGRDGVIFARGRGIRPGPSGDVSVSDITPTILAWLGLPVADDMDGRPAPFLETRPTERIATYETKAVPRLEVDGKSGAEELYIQQLRELGYIEE